MCALVRLWSLKAPTNNRFGFGQLMDFHCNPFRCILCASTLIGFLNVSPWFSYIVSVIQFCYFDFKLLIKIHRSIGRVFNARYTPQSIFRFSIFPVKIFRLLRRYNQFCWHEFDTEMRKCKFKYRNSLLINCFNFAFA